MLAHFITFTMTQPLTFTLQVQKPLLIDWLISKTKRQEQLMEQSLQSLAESRLIDWLNIDSSGFSEQINLGIEYLISNIDNGGRYGTT